MFFYTRLTSLWLCLQIKHVTASLLLSTTASLTDVAGYCPYHRTCDDGEVDEASTLWFDDCCLRCDCSDECFLKGNCCQGKTYPPAQQPVNRTCTQTFIDFVPDVYYGKIIYKNASYILKLTDISLCIDETMEKCLHPNSTLLTEFTPVFDKSKRIHYRNKFCAQCDGAVEANTLSWPARISCYYKWPNTLRYFLKLDDNDDLQVLESVRERTCTIAWEPPEWETAQWCVHTDDIITTCPPNAHFAFYETEECDSRLTNDTVHAPIFQEGALFKNVACAYCNIKVIPLSSAGICKTPFSEPPLAFVFTLDVDNVLHPPEAPGDCLHYSEVH